MLRVSEIMHSGAVGIRSDASVRELLQLLAQEHISGVPVMDRGNQIKGVVSNTDIVRCAALHGQSNNAVQWDEFQVEDIMTQVPLTVRPDMTVPDLARYMVELGIHRALVTTNGKLIGIVTAFDVMRATAN